MSTDTPRTDQAAKILLSSFKEGFEQSALWKSFDLCRDLERELAANAAELVRVRAERDGANKLLSSCKTAMQISMGHGGTTDWTNMIAAIDAALRAAVPGTG